ncbi:hypothetical protein [Methylobacter sp.]|uniref:hypothetical protein n=1 Tax=Methylobacter sp. TaxID=2051955 RepID=UPI002FDE7449
MNIKKILPYLAALTLSFNVFAVEVQEEPKIIAQDKIELSQGNSPDILLATHIVNSHTIPQASNEKPSEFITALSVYLIIIIVYSIYGFRANAKNIEN